MIETPATAGRRRRIPFAGLESDQKERLLDPAFVFLMSMTRWATGLIAIASAKRPGGTPSRRRRRRVRRERPFRGLKQSKLRVVEFVDPRIAEANARRPYPRRDPRVL